MRWYIIIWVYAIVQIKKGKGLYKIKIAEAKWWLMGTSAFFKSLAISALSAVFLDSPQPINVFKFLTGDNFMIGLLIYFFIPFVLFDYFTVFYKDRYLKFENQLTIKNHGWLIWLALHLILPACIFLGVLVFLFLNR